MNKPVLGWVYVLTNDAFKEGIIKIGFTNKPTPQERAQELSKHTGVPTEFKVVYAVKVPHAQQVEGKIHQILQHKRARQNREFFECTIAEAIKIIHQVAGKQVVETIDYRKRQLEKSPIIDNKKQPERKTVNQASVSPQKNKTPSASKSANKSKSTKSRKGMIIMSILGIIIVFLAAMWYIGVQTEKKEQANTHFTNNIPAQSSPRPNANHSPQEQMQLAWDNIPSDIRAKLQEEQDLWRKQTEQTCQQQNDCLAKAYQKRAEYLKGYSIR